MMKQGLTGMILAGMMALLWQGPGSAANKASGIVKIGYTYVDQEGSLNVNQETYNLYDGVGVSLLNWRFIADNGLAITGDLANITLANRNLRVTIGKPGLFNLSLTHNEYRRTYDFDGARFTRRRTTGGQLGLQPHRLIKLFGGISVTEKHGNSFDVFSPLSDTVIAHTDYSHRTYNIGTLLGDRRASLRAEYRRFRLDDRTSLNPDRAADNFSAAATVLAPGHEWIVLSGGYVYRRDKALSAPSRLETDQMWGSTKLYLPHYYVIDYRLIYALAKHTEPKRETDHIIHTVSVARNWPRYGGLRVGYEYRIADDFVDKTASSGLLANGWLKPADRWHLSAMVAIRKNRVKEGATLMGDENVTRHQVTAKYADTAWGGVTLQWQSRVRRNDDIDSRVDYRTLSTQLDLGRWAYGRLTVAWTYYVGRFENRSDNIGFEFSDHVLSGTIHPRTWSKIDIDLGATYYRSRRNTDVEKSNLKVGVMYTFLRNHHIEARYNVFNYDDYLARDQYYTANIVEVNIIKDLDF